MLTTLMVLRDKFFSLLLNECNALLSPFTSISLIGLVLFNKLLFSHNCNINLYCYNVHRSFEIKNFSNYNLAQTDVEVCV